MSSEDRLLWVFTALVAAVLVGVLSGLLTAVAGGPIHIALGAGGVAALGTFGAVLTAVRFLFDPGRK